MICWKIRIFAYWTTPNPFVFNALEPLWFAEKFVSLLIEQHPPTSRRMTTRRCDLLKNSYLCLLNNTRDKGTPSLPCVVICWKIRIFAYWTTPAIFFWLWWLKLWFAEKFVSLLIEQHHYMEYNYIKMVVICWKIRIFAYWTTPTSACNTIRKALWFAEKFVSLLIEQHRCPHRSPVLVGCDLLKNSYLCLLNNT